MGPMFIQLPNSYLLMSVIILPFTWSALDGKTRSQIDHIYHHIQETQNFVTL